MKTFYLIVNLLLLGTVLTAQSLEQEVIAPFGSLLQGSGGMDLHCTMGEPVVERFENGEILTQGFHQVFDIATPVFETPDANIELKVFPNPATDWIAVETDATETLMLTLFDTYGQTLYDSEMTNPTATLDVSKLPGGSYYLSIHSDAGLIQTFIIQKVK